MSNLDLPPDAQTGREAARQVGMPYDTLRKWWRRGKVNSWAWRGRRYVSVGEVRRAWEELQRPRYTGGPGAMWLTEPTAP